MAEEDTYAAFLATLERVRAGKDKAFNPRPAFDEKLAREVSADRTQGRKIEDYLQALEYLGFVYMSADQLNTTPGIGPMWGENGPILHRVGQWRNLRDAAQWPEIRYAFKSETLVRDFLTPREFFEWYAAKRTEARARAAGVIVPAGLVIV